jgi:hypothetical protein
MRVDLADAHPTRALAKPSTDPKTWWLVAMLAALVVGLVSIPISVWHQPNYYAVYKGFDPNLIYIDPRGGGSAVGLVQASQGAVQLIALPASQPTIHLLSSQMDFRVALDLRVLENQVGTQPLQVFVWNPREETRYSLSFGPAPLNEVTSEVQIKGVPSRKRIEGTYVSGLVYHLEIWLDRRSSHLRVLLNGLEKVKTGSRAIVLIGGPSEPGYRELDSDYVPVVSGQDYRFGGTVKLLSGTNNYKLIVDWYNKSKGHIGSSNDWQPTSTLNGWTPKEFKATAPSGAAYARMVLGAGDGRTTVLVSSLFLNRITSPERNLLLNGSFSEDMKGWSVAGATTPGERFQIVEPKQGPIFSDVTPAEAPALFLELPVAVTAMSVSAVGSGTAAASLENLRIGLPQQRWLAMRVDDQRALLLTVGLAGLCLLLLIAALFTLGVRKLRRARQSADTKGLSYGQGRGPIVIRRRTLVLALAGILAYLAVNVASFQLASHSFDMMGEKSFSYVGAVYGTPDIYFLSAISSPANVWGGIPYAGEIFPYGPIMAYIFTGIGWLYRIFLAGPGDLRLDTFQLEFLIKTTNVLFGLADSLLIYAILHRLGVRLKWCMIASALFLLNPATWFVMSVWGETQTISLLFILLSVWFGLRGYGVAAWLSLGAASLTRPQIAVPVLIVGVFLLRSFSFKRSVHAISWTVIAVFLVLTPLLLTTAPSLPLDYITQSINAQNPVGSGAAKYIYVSYDGYNLWPLLTYFVSGQVGKARLYFPASEPLWSGLSYTFVSNAATLAFVATLLLGLLFKRRLATRGLILLPFLAAATLGLVVLRTGVSPHHFLLALGLLIVSIASFRSVGGYLAIVGLLTLTTFVSLYGSLGVALASAPEFGPPLDPRTNSVTRLFIALYQSDRFITLATLANVVSLLILAIVAFRRLKGRTAPRVAEPEPVGDFRLVATRSADAKAGTGV